MTPLVQLDPPPPKTTAGTFLAALALVGAGLVVGMALGGILVSLGAEPAPVASGATIPRTWNMKITGAADGNRTLTCAEKRP